MHPTAQADINSPNVITARSEEYEEDEFVLMNNIGTSPPSQISHVSDLAVDEVAPRQEVLRKFSGMDVPTRN